MGSAEKGIQQKRVPLLLPRTLSGKVFRTVADERTGDDRKEELALTTPLAFFEQPLGACVLLAGGVGLFLHGLEQASLASRALFGSRTKRALASASNRPLLALTLGMLFSAVSQSSTAATAFAVGLVNAGILPLAGSVAVMMGASLGTAIVTFLLSLDIVSWSPLLLALGATLARTKRFRLSGDLLTGVSLLLLAMLLIKLSVAPLAAHPLLKELMLSLANRPFLLGLASLLLTALLQSSAAVMALTIALAGSGLLPVDAALPVIFGAHIGSSATVLLAGIGARRNARALSWATLLYKTGGTLALIPASSLLIGLTASVASLTARAAILQALVVTLNALILFPFRRQLAETGVRLSASKFEDPAEPIFLDDEVQQITPLALSLLSHELLRLGNQIEASLHLLFSGLPEEKDLRQELVAASPKLAESCTDYLPGIRTGQDFPRLRAEQASLGQAAVCLRNMAEIVSRELAPLLSRDEEGLNSPTLRRLSEAAETLFRENLGAFALGGHMPHGSSRPGLAHFGREAAAVRWALSAHNTDSFAGDQGLRILRFIGVLESLVLKAEDLTQGESRQDLSERQEKGE